MKLIYIFISVFLVLLDNNTPKEAKKSNNSTGQIDTSLVIKLNQDAYNNRLTNPDLTIIQGEKALLIAEKLKYKTGIAEAHRVLGIGKYYLNQIDSSIESYLTALAFFKEENDLVGQAKVYNNIGNLYRDLDNKKSLYYFNKSLNIAKKLQIKELIAGLYLNIGTVNQRMQNYSRALLFYKHSLHLFTILGNIVGIVQSQQNLGLIYLNIQQFDTAEQYLIKAKKQAYEFKLYNSIASINLTLSSVYIAKKSFHNAEVAINEGMIYAQKVKDPKLVYNLTLTSYKLENTRKNYQLALHYLKKVYQQDSVTYKSNVSDKISLLEAQHRQLEKQKENELTIAKQKYAQILFWASSLVALLAFFVIFLLVRNVKKSTNTNKELTRLNLEISKQKDDLDKINQNLEEIISERTKDLKVKNKKLSEYSSHLSHQVRSPVASLKGLMLLEKDDLIDKEEFIEQMSICIHDLDDKIININENLNNPSKPSLINED
ncbi:tetratricopeptide repeat protein [Daejeonella sp. H1SJ63]|uniref:tetratricopeptide repeat protein n=1 Tax=Daejeonella sp. H1SJ63 TaxID=3034145 RepID=UPI0023EDF487|nr:tetratricopeptide repeat protein [Daejeonella sp. H1SJ63]